MRNTNISYDVSCKLNNPVGFGLAQELSTGHAVASLMEQPEHKIISYNATAMRDMIHPLQMTIQGLLVHVVLALCSGNRIKIEIPPPHDDEPVTLRRNWLMLGHVKNPQFAITCLNKRPKSKTPPINLSRSLWL